MGSYRPSCDQVNGGDGCSGSASRALRPPKLLSPLVFASESERGLVVGSVVVEAIGREVVVGCSCRVVMGVIRKGFFNQKRFHGSFFLER